MAELLYLCTLSIFAPSQCHVRRSNTCSIDYLCQKSFIIFLLLLCAELEDSQHKEERTGAKKKGAGRVRQEERSGDVWTQNNLVKSSTRFPKPVVSADDFICRFQEDFPLSELERRVTDEQRKLRPKRSAQTVSCHGLSPSVFKLFCLGVPVKEADLEPLITY